MPLENHALRKAKGENIARPYLNVTYINPHTDKSFRTKALIDTGADRCILPAGFAEILGHDLTKGKEADILTASGRDTCHGHTMQIEMPGFKTQELLILFSSSVKIPLLGVTTFLSNFTLTIDYPNLNFSLKLPENPEESLSAWDTI